MSFAKLDSQIVMSTVWMEPDHILRVWIAMLALKDADGFVAGTAPGLANIARVSLELTREALARLTAPDPDSRTQDNEGRRIEPIEGGWVVLNHAKYRDKADTEGRRRQVREAVARHRSKKTTTKSVIKCNHGVISGKPIQIQRSDTDPSPPTPPYTNGVCDSFEEAWGVYPKRPNNSKAKARKAWDARVKAGEDPAVMLAGVHAYAAYVERERMEPKFIKQAATFFGPDTPYADDYAPPPERRIHVYIDDDEAKGFSPEFLKATGLKAPS